MRNWSMMRRLLPDLCVYPVMLQRDVAFNV